MLLAYNTNGLAYHRLEDAFEVLAAIGYSAVAVTLERDLLDPPDRGAVVDATDKLNRLRERTGMELTIETGARFLLDPFRKHQPTLLSDSPEERARRREFLLASIELGGGCGARCVSLWSGTPAGKRETTGLWARLEDEVGALTDCAERAGVRLGFEPEPGMFVETMAQFARLHDAIDHPLFGLTLDVGHVHCLGDGDPPGQIRRWRDKLFNVHIEDMRRGVHAHLMFGDGEMAFAPVVETLLAVGYKGPLTVELSRHSHDAVETARRAFEFLQRFTA